MNSSETASRATAIPGGDPTLPWNHPYWHQQQRCSCRIETHHQHKQKHTFCKQQLQNNRRKQISTTGRTQALIISITEQPLSQVALAVWCIRDAIRPPVKSRLCRELASTVALCYSACVKRNPTHKWEESWESLLHLSDLIWLC